MQRRLNSPLPRVFNAGRTSGAKNAPSDFALYGGPPLFADIRSASNLVQPNPPSILGYLRQSYDTAKLTHGVCVAELERRLAAIHEADHCIAMCNGLWAIVMCLEVLKLPGKSEVVMPSMTYRRLADIAAWVELTPHFCDIDESTLAVTPHTILPCLNDETAILLVAHPIVNVCDVRAIEQFATSRQLPLVFDAVEAAHASVGGRMLGGFGDAECYSMHASKFLNGFEAGYVTTNNAVLAKRLRTLINPDLARRSKVTNHRSFRGTLSELHAAMALASLDDLEDQIDRNRVRHQLYREALEPLEGCDLVPYDDEQTRTFKNTLVELNDHWPLTRDLTLRLLQAENLLVRPYYSPPLHRKQTSYRTVHGPLPVTERLEDRFLLLPSGEFLHPDDIAPIGSLLQAIERLGSQLGVD